MIAQRMKHREAIKIVDEQDTAVIHTSALVTRFLGEELDRIVRELPKMKDLGTPDTFRQARGISEAMILNGEFDPD
ncbi:MAG: hypothetical protein WBP79_16960 [Candidatus Acidiferrales bacterium]